MQKLLRLVLMVCVAMSLFLGGKAPITSASEGWLPGWGKRIQLTIDHNKVSANFQNFPVLVHLSFSSGIDKSDVSPVFDELKNYNNRFKIALTEGDGTTQLYVEIERWEAPNKEAWLWVKVPSVSSQVDTILYLYFDLFHADNQAMVGDTGSIPAQKVWDTNFVMVQHMEQDGTATPKNFKDSTSHKNDGVEDHNNIIASPQPTPSVIGLGQAFDNTSAITIPDNDCFSLTTTGELTISLWVSESVPNFKSGGFVNFMGKGTSNQYEWSFVFYQRDWTDRSQRISFYVDNPKGGLGSGSYTQKPVAVNEWVHITAKMDSQYTYIYRNGVFERRDFYKGPDAYVEIFPQNCNQPVRIGTRDFGTWFEGRIDEVRISNVARTNAYIGTSYQSETDNLIRFGVVQNDLPVFNPVGEQFITAGENITFGVSATNRSTKPLTYSSANLPPGAIFNASSQIFSWTPQTNQVGTYVVRFRVSDGAYIGSLDVKITVTERPETDRPVITPIPGKSINTSETLAFKVSAISKSGKPLTYSAADLPTGANFEPSIQTFSWTPRSNQAGTYVVRFIVSDGVLSASLDVRITVTEHPGPPVFNPITDKFITAGTSVTFGVSATSRSGRPLSYSATELPAGASFEPSSQTFSWIPQINQVGTYIVRFTVSDGVLNASMDIRITVTSPEPSISTDNKTTVQPSGNQSGPSANRTPESEASQPEQKPSFEEVPTDYSLLVIFGALAAAGLIITLVIALARRGGRGPK